MQYRFTMNEFRQLRATPEFNKWFGALRSDPRCPHHLKELGQQVILPQFIPWNNPPMVTGVGGQFVETLEGRFRDWGQVAYWARMLPNKRFGACLYNVLHPSAVLAALKVLHLSGMDMVAYGTTGSDAVDIAIKMAMQVQKERNKKREYQMGDKIISIKGAYHGSTGLGLYVSGNPDHPALDDGKYLPPIRWVERLPDVVKDREWVEKFNTPDLSKTVALLDTAAVIYEPVQGVRGIYPLFTGIAEILYTARMLGILTIADEVTTAPAKTGRMFASQYLQIMPDMICLGKAITNADEVLSMVLINEETAATVRGFTDFYYGHCLGGHPEATARALEVFEELEKMDAPRLARELGGYFLQNLKCMDGVGGIVEVRGIGLMIGVQFRDSKRAREVNGGMRGRGHLIGTEGNTMLIKAPLDIARADIDEFCGDLRQAIVESTAH